MQSKWSAKHVCALLGSFGLVTLKPHERSAMSSVKTRDRKESRCEDYTRTKTRPSSWKRSTHCSTSAIMRPQNDSGRRTRFSAALLSHPGERVCPISSRAFRQRCSTNRERTWQGGDLVIVHGRFSGFRCSLNWIAADLVAPAKRNPGRALGRHSGRAPEEQSTSKRPMFGNKSPK